MSEVVSVDDLFPSPSGDFTQRMDALLDLIEETFPLPGRFRSGLPRDVAELSRSLTDRRSERDDGYLGRPAALSAYVRYFLPWNVYRLSRLLPSLPLRLDDGDCIVDLGTGPLTVPIALYLSCPELRDKELEFRCLDRTGKVLDAGRALFAGLIGAGDCPWKIKTIRGSLGTRIEGPKAALVTAANVLNELFWNDRASVQDQAERKAVLLSALAREDGSILIVEPGIPRSGEFIAALREAFIELDRPPLGPCPHSLSCPFPGGRRGAKWCHFAFETEGAPARLHKLSTAAGIPKERATLTFLLSGPQGVSVEKMERTRDRILLTRIISDAFPIENGKFGRYACSAKGAVLVSGPRPSVESLRSGGLLSFPHTSAPERRDPKSAAFILPIE